MLFFYNFKFCVVKKDYLIVQSYEKGQKQASSHSCIEVSKTQLFAVSIVKSLEESQLDSASAQIHNVLLFTCVLLFLLEVDISETGNIRSRSTAFLRKWKNY